MANVSCPAGQQLTGAGGDINTFNGQIVLDAVFASLDATGGGFAAFEDDTGNSSPVERQVLRDLREQRPAGGGEERRRQRADQEP